MVLAVILAAIAACVSACWIAVVIWTYRDVRQRTRDPLVRGMAVVVAAVLFVPGQFLYLIVRPRHTLTQLYERSLEEEALLQELEERRSCPSCQRRVEEDFLVCPTCRAPLKESCTSCGKPVNFAWLACPYCGREKPARAGHGPVVLQPQRRGLMPGGYTPGSAGRQRQAGPAATALKRPPSPDPFAPRRKALPRQPEEPGLAGGDGAQ